MIATAITQAPETNGGCQLRSSLLLHVWAAGALLNKTADQVREMILSGELLWAFDIGASPVKREVRVLALSVDDCLAKSFQDRPWLEIADWILPDQAAVSAKDLAQSWSCDPDHVAALIRKKLLHRVPNTLWRRGPGGSPMIERSSAIEFLKSRRVW